MPTDPNRADFLSDLERIQNEYPADPRPEPSDTPSLLAMFGVFKDNVRFDAVMRGVEAERQRQRGEAAQEYAETESRSKVAA